MYLDSSANSLYESLESRGSLWTSIELIVNCRVCGLLRSSAWFCNRACWLLTDAAATIAIRKVYGWTDLLQLDVNLSHLLCQHSFYKAQYQHVVVGDPVHKSALQSVLDWLLSPFLPLRCGVPWHNVISSWIGCIVMRRIVIFLTLSPPCIFSVGRAPTPPRINRR